VRSWARTEADGSRISGRREEISEEVVGRLGIALGVVGVAMERAVGRCVLRYERDSFRVVAL